MSDIKRLVSAATAQWLPVALGALAVPSGARHQRKSPQSQGPSVCVCVCETWWMSSQAWCCGNLHERDPTRQPQKLLSASSFRLLASLFIFAQGGAGWGGRTLSLSLSFHSLSMSLALRRAGWPITAALLSSRHLKAATISNIYTDWVSTCFSVGLFTPHISSIWS